MTGYIFRIEGIQARLEFIVLAETRAEAVRTANDGLRKTGFCLAGDHIVLPEFANGGWLVELAEEVTAEQITGIAFLPPADLLRGCDVLTVAGYVYAGEPSHLEADGAPVFTKNLRFPNSSNAQLLMKVQAEFLSGRDVFDFQIGAEVTVVASAPGNEETPYALTLQDGRECVSAGGLARALEVYERKFLGLVEILLRADSD